VIAELFREDLRWLDELYGRERLGPPRRILRRHPSEQGSPRNGEHARWVA
jgi:hypothetical protein